MRSFVSRRLRNSAIAIAAVAAVAIWCRWQDYRLARTDFQTGYLLLAALLFLAAYNLRKKIPVASWGSSAAWLQTHIYVGLASAAVFGMHISWRLPNGYLESTLAVLYGLTFASGLLGLYWTRTLPPKLANVAEEVIYERIPMLRSQLQERAQQVALAAVRSSGATTLGEYYAENLQSYFERPRRLGYYLKPNSELRRSHLAGLTSIGRYLSSAEQQYCEQLFALIRRRDDLDFHSALQWRLKMWLFLHIGLTYPLLLLAALHGVLAHLFDGGVL